MSSPLPIGAAFLAVFFAGGACNAFTHPSSVKTVYKDKVRTEVVEVPVSASPQPPPSAAPLPLPQSCARIEAEAQALVTSLYTSSAHQASLIRLLDKVGTDIYQHDTVAIGKDQEKARRIGDGLSSERIAQLETVDRLNDALSKCRQETSK